MMHFVGIDLSGPVNTADTAVVVFTQAGHHLQLAEWRCAAGDQTIFDLLGSLLAAGKVVLGLDAPLSYNPGGGDRPADRQLREKAAAAGLPPGTIMTPTMTRMAYLALRGIHLAHSLARMQPSRIEIIETHPGSVFAFHGADSAKVRQLKSSQAARGELLLWVADQGLTGLERLPDDNDHLVAACACALGAWKWWRGESVWSYPAAPPEHPFPVAC